MGRVDRDITCINNDGFTLTFGEGSASPFLLSDATGCYDLDNNVVISDNTMSDGGAYLGSVSKVRNIILTLRDNKDNVSNRNLLFTLFRSRSKGTLIFREGDNQRQINYYVEYIHCTGNYGSRTYIVSLLCDDPYWYAMDDIVVYLANWEDDFEFLHEFQSAGEEFGHRSADTIADIINQNAESGIGLTIAIEALGAVVNPSVTHIQTGDAITVGHTGKQLTMSRGDVLTITTSDNDKHVYLTHNGNTSEINEYLTEDSVFIQLTTGMNTIGYDADSGQGNMMVNLSYRLKFAGA